MFGSWCVLFAGKTCSLTAIYSIFCDSHIWRLNFKYASTLLKEFFFEFKKPPLNLVYSDELNLPMKFEFLFFIKLLCLFLFVSFMFFETLECFIVISSCWASIICDVRLGNFCLICEYRLVLEKFQFHFEKLIDFLFWSFEI